MCGIFGLLGADLTPEAVASLNNLLTHRGPDDAGLYQGQGVVLAARRLSIVDVAGGHQPLSNEDQTLWVTYNGEIVNAPALRAELRAAGHRFQTETDTEVIVHAYEAWGLEAVPRLRGMFAFGLWDVPRRRLLLARDRFGIKPLYYAHSAERFAFASEVRPVLAALPRLPRHLDPLALRQLFSVGFLPATHSAFAGVRQVPAAHLYLIEAGQHHCRPYWQLHYPEHASASPRSLEAATEEFMARLRQVVADWRLSDVPIGSLLSGGVDSGALAALLTELNAAPIHTFTIGFASPTHDETAPARATARHLASQSHELIFTFDDFNLLPQVVEHLEAPQCSATSVPLYLLYRACHQAGFKVILTGEGADELLGGYHWFDGDRRLRPWLFLPAPARAFLAGLPTPTSVAARRVLARGDADPLGRYRLWQEVASPAQRAALLHMAEATQPPDLLEHLIATTTDPLANRHPLHQFLWLEAHTRMVDFINYEVDRLSMAHSVEARPPFLDHTLWEFCATLPADFKLSPLGNKRLLRAGVRDLLPAPARQRPKRGLASPHAAWFRQTQLPPWAEDCLHPTALTETGYFNPNTVRHLRAQHQAGRADTSRLLMGVLTTQLWHAAFGLA